MPLGKERPTLARVPGPVISAPRISGSALSNNAGASEASAQLSSRRGSGSPTFFGRGGKGGGRSWFERLYRGKANARQAPFLCNGAERSRAEQRGLGCLFPRGERRRGRKSPRALGEAGQATGRFGEKRAPSSLRQRAST